MSYVLQYKTDKLAADAGASPQDMNWYKEWGLPEGYKPIELYSQAGGHQAAVEGPDGKIYDWDSEKQDLLPIAGSMREYVRMRSLENRKSSILPDEIKERSYLYRPEDIYMKDFRFVNNTLRDVAPWIRGNTMRRKENADLFKVGTPVAMGDGSVWVRTPTGEIVQMSEDSGGPLPERVEASDYAAFLNKVSTTSKRINKQASYNGYNPYVDKHAYGTWMGDTFIGRDDRFQPKVATPPIDWFGAFPLGASLAGGIVGGVAGYNHDRGMFRKKTRERLLNAALGAAAGAGAGFAGSNLLNLAATGYRHLQNVTPVVSFPANAEGRKNVPYYKQLTEDPAIRVSGARAPGLRSWGDIMGKNKSGFAHVPL